MQGAWSQLVGRRPLPSGSSFTHLFRVNSLLLVASGSTGVFNFLYHVVVGHLLGPARYGTVAALVNVTYITVLIPSTIILTVFARAAAALSSREQMGELRDLWSALTIRLVILGLIAMLTFTFVLSGPLAGFLQIPHSGGTVALLGLLYVTALVIPVNQGLLQGTQRFGWLALVTAAGPILRVFLAVILVALGGGAGGAIMALVLSGLLPYAVSLWRVSVVLQGIKRAHVSLRPWLAYSSAVAVSTICTVLLYNLDTILAKHFLPTVAAGQYAAVSTGGKIVYFVGGSIVIVMFPKVAAAHTRGEGHGHLLAFSFCAVLALSLVVVALFSAFPAFVLAHMFGPSFVAEKGVLPWYGVAMLLFALSGVFTQYFLSLDDRRFLWIMVVCCLGQASALWIWHATVREMVYVVTWSMAVLLALLSLWYALRVRLLSPLAS